jgi:hypothetical protein
MRKVLVSLLIVGVVWAFTVPAATWAAAPTASGTYSFTTKTKSSDPNISKKSLSPNPYASLSLSNFYNTLGADLAAKGGPCNGLVFGKFGASTVGKILGGIGKAALKGPIGDETYAAGVVNLDGNGSITDGTAIFNTATSAKAGGTNSAELNNTNTGSVAVLCGGPNEGSRCNAPFVCDGAETTLKLQKPGKTGSTTDCHNAYGINADGTSGGGYVQNSDGSGASAVWVYPIAAGIDLTKCASGTPASGTYAECCHDPALTLVVHLGSGISAGGNHIDNVFTDQTDSGYSVNTRQ